MGLYFSYTFTCLECGNFNTFESGPLVADDTYKYLCEAKPKIICGRCGSDKIQGLNYYFNSVDMIVNNSSQLYQPSNLDEVWVMPDCLQRLTGIVYLDVEYVFQNGERYSSLTHFSDFKDYAEREPTSPHRLIVPFKREKKLSEIQDLYLSTIDKYKDYVFCPVYADRIPEGKAISDYDNDDVLFYEEQYATRYIAGDDGHIICIPPKFAVDNR